MAFRAPCHSGTGVGMTVAQGRAGVMAMKTVLTASLAVVLIATGGLADDSRDADYLADVINQRLETQRMGVEVPWLNPTTGSSGMIVILQTDNSDPNLPCRTYLRTTERPGEPTLMVEGTACRVGERLWQRNETSITAVPGPDAAPPAPVAEREPPVPAPLIPPPQRKPDPNVFYASIPTPSVY